MRRLFALMLSMLLVVLMAPSATAAVEATYNGGGTGGTSVTMFYTKAGQSQPANHSVGTKLFDLDVSGEGTLPAYCIDIRTGIQQATYEERGWEVAGAQRAKILWILKYSYPTRSLGDLAAAALVSGLTASEAIGATQAAIWTFSDNATYVPFGSPTPSQARINAVVTYLTGSANTGLTTPPAPSLSLTPGAATGPVGSRVGPFTLTVSDGGSADLTLQPNLSALRIYTKPSGGTPVTNATSGAQLWIDVPAGTDPSSVTLKATAKTTAFAGRVFTKKGAPDASQKLILAKDTEATATATATATWTKAPAKPSARISSECVPTGGAAGTVTLTNDAVKPGEPVTFTVTVPGMDDQKVTVPAGETRTVDFALAEDAKDRTVQVTAPGMDKVSSVVSTDCQVSEPRATISARCEPAPAGGATVTIDLGNPAEPGQGQTAVPTMFTVFVDGTKQTIDGKDSWTVAPGGTQQLTLTLPEGATNAAVVVKADGSKVAEKSVSTDCAVDPKPRATVSAECKPAPAGGATVTVDLANSPQLTGGQSSLPVTFTVEVDGQPRSVDGATSWTVAPGSTVQLTFDLPEGTSSTVVVKAGGTTVAEEPVSTDCAVDPDPQATVGAQCLAEGGATVSIDLRNDPALTGGQSSVPVTFTVLVDGIQQTIGDQDSWTVRPGGSKDLSFALPEDSGPRTVEVRAGELVLATQVVGTDCQVSDPTAVISARCEPAPAGGATVTVDLGNPVEPGEGQFPVSSRFTVFVDGVQQEVDEKDAWVVEPGESRTLTLTLAEDSGDRTVVVTADGSEIATQVVSTDCTVPASPASTVAGTCLVQPGGGAAVTVVLANTATPGEGQTGLAAEFTIEVDGTPQAVEGATSWTVAAGAKKELSFTLPEDSGNRAIVVKVGGTRVAEQVVTTDCQGIVVSAEGICRNDAPFYDLSVTTRGLPAIDPATGQPYTVTVQWLQAADDGRLLLQDGKPVAAFDPATDQPYVDTFRLGADGTLRTGALLWKGATIDAFGNPTDWPGWDQLADGSWVQVPDGGVRPATVLRVSVNPTADTVALYPPATPGCNANPPQAVVDPIEDEVVESEEVTGDDESVVAGSEDLADTGADLAALLATSILAVVAGMALLMMGRRARR